MYDMKTNALTIRLDKNLDDLLTKASRRSGRNRSEIAREALRRQLRTANLKHCGENDALRRSTGLSDRRGCIYRGVIKVFLDAKVFTSAVATRGLCADVLRLVLHPTRFLYQSKCWRNSKVF